MKENIEFTNKFKKHGTIDRIPIITQIRKY